jgi:hypothetical protein
LNPQTVCEQSVDREGSRKKVGKTVLDGRKDEIPVLSLTVTKDVLGKSQELAGASVVAEPQESPSPEIQLIVASQMPVVVPNWLSIWRSERAQIEREQRKGFLRILQLLVMDLEDPWEGESLAQGQETQDILSKRLGDQFFTAKLRCKADTGTTQRHSFTFKQTLPRIPQRARERASVVAGP